MDANGAYDLFDPAHLALLKAFDRFGLLMIEQPGRNDDILDHARQLASLETPICMDESIRHATHARQALQLWEEYSSLSRLVVNIKPPGWGGYLEAIRIARLCADRGVSVWCGDVRIRPGEDRQRALLLPGGSEPSGGPRVPGPLLRAQRGLLSGVPAGVPDGAHRDGLGHRGPGPGGAP